MSTNLTAVNSAFSNHKTVKLEFQEFEVFPGSEKIWAYWSATLGDGRVFIALASNPPVAPFEYNGAALRGQVMHVDDIGAPAAFALDTPAMQLVTAADLAYRQLVSYVVFKSTLPRNIGPLDT